MVVFHLEMKVRKNFKMKKNTGKDVDKDIEIRLLLVPNSNC